MNDQELSGVGGSALARGGRPMAAPRRALARLALWTCLAFALPGMSACCGEGDECCEDHECESGACNEGGVCVACVDDSDCPVATPVCVFESSSFRCVACEKSSDCPSATPNCDTNRNTCF